MGDSPVRELSRGIPMSKLDWGDLGILALSAALAATYLSRTPGSRVWMVAALIFYALWIFLLLLALLPVLRSRLTTWLDRIAGYAHSDRDHTSSTLNSLASSTSNSESRPKNRSLPRDAVLAVSTNASRRNSVRDHQRELGI